MVSANFLGIGTAVFIAGILGIGGFILKLFTDLQILNVSIIMAFVGAAYMVFSFVIMAGGAVNDQLRDNKTLHAGDSNVFSVGLLRCMLAITIADDKIMDSEIASLTKIYKHLTGSNVDEETVRYTAEGMLEDGADIKTELETIRPVLNKVLRQQMIIASLYVLAADGDMNDDELIMLDDIREGLGMSMGQCESIKKNFLKNYTGELKA
jgi:uncharacterized tellurite resistance protein B-like protein